MAFVPCISVQDIAAGLAFCKKPGSPRTHPPPKEEPP